jgi:hypothetical protein
MGYKRAVTIDGNFVGEKLIHPELTGYNFYKTKRNHKSFCQEHNGFGINESLLEELMHGEPCVDAVVIEYDRRDGWTMFYTSKPGDFRSQGVRDRLHRGWDVKYYLAKNDFREVRGPV